jgi:hypothetical protein
MTCLYFAGGMTLSERCLATKLMFPSFFVAPEVGSPLGVGCGGPALHWPKTESKASQGGDPP